jgi:hypothetical protein
MSSEKSPKFELVLTKKWDAKIRLWAYMAKVPYDDAKSIAMELEWQIWLKIKDLSHQRNYFLRVLPHKIYAVNKGWWNTKRVRNNVPDLDILDTIVTMRDFHAISYDHLIKHLHALLTELDKVAAEMFMVKIGGHGLKWNCIQRESYPKMSHRQFYNRVRLIERIALKETQTHGSAVC